jgi:hypothetical protein
MGALDHQLGVVDETTYGTAVTVSRFFEYNSESIEETEGRTEGDPLRSGSHVIRNDRFTPYFSGAAGAIQLDVMSKGFGFWLKHMLGAVATTGLGPYTHTGTVADLYGDFFTAQVNKPFHPSGTNQAFTYSGGKVASWTLSNSVDANLLVDLECDFQNVATNVALAAASYPASMDNLTWAGGVVTIGGSAYDVTEFSVSCNNGLDVDRRQIRANTLKKEPTAGRREIEFSISADFDSLTQRNRAHASVRADALATLSGKWTFGTASLEVSIPAGRFDGWSAPTSGPEAITQTLTGVGRWNGTDSPVSLIYVSDDATA